MGGSPSVPVTKAPDAAQEYQQSLAAYVSQAPQLYAEESQYQPLYNQMQQQIMGSNIEYYTRAIEGQMSGAQAALQGTQNQAIQNAMQQYGGNVGAINQMVMQNNPALQQIEKYGNQQINAGQDQTLQGILGNVMQQAPGQSQQLQDLASKASTMYDPTNARLQGYAEQVGSLTGQTVGQLQGLAGQAAADPRNEMFRQTQGEIMGQLGKLDPVTQQLSDMAQQQLALGGQVSQQGLQDADQAARAAFSARGMLNSTGSIASEVLNRDAVQQARLQQREQFGMGVGQMVDSETRARTAAAMGLTQFDIGTTQANQQLAGQLYQAAGGLGQSGAQVQGGLQGQIAANLGNAAQMQGALTQQAISNQQTNAQLAAGLQGGILDEQFRRQQAGAQNLQYLYGAQSGAQGAILGTQSGGASLMQAMMSETAGMGTGSPNLFAGSGLLQLTAQNQMAGYNQQNAANQMNAQSAGASKGAMIGAGAAIGSAVIMGVALF